MSAGREIYIGQTGSILISPYGIKFYVIRRVAVQSDLQERNPKR